MGHLVVQPGRVYARHVTLDPGSPFRLLGKGLRASSDGINGRGGWQRAGYDDRLGEHGDFELVLPNGPGSDGRLHLHRFECLRTDRSYHPGDEWIELWRDGDEQPLYVGTPVQPVVTPTRITLRGVDARAPEVLGKQRETAAAFLLGAPPDVVSALTDAWTIPAHAHLAGATAPVLTHSTTEQDTSDGVLRYLRAETVAGRGGELRPAGATAFIRTTATVTTGVLARGWRAETLVNRSAVTATVELRVDQAALGAADAIVLTVSSDTAALCSSGTSTHTPPNLKIGTSVHLAVEGRGRWVFFYLDAALVAVLPAAQATIATRHVFASATGALNSTVAFLLARQRDRFITPQILDRRTPGLPVATGLQGAYVDEPAAISGQPDRLLDPTRGPYARRVDPVIDFPVANPPAWQPPGTAGTRMSVRWTGSIHLDLDQHDIRLRVSADDQARVYVANTDLGGEYLAAAGTGPWLRTHLGTQQPGWYPVVIEYSNLSAGGGITLEAERSTAPATWVKPGAAGAPALSPQGVYEHYARHDAHAEQITDVQRDTGLQTRLRPRSVESGEFPGRLQIARRIGQDTDLVVDDREGSQGTRDLNAGDVAASLLADAAIGPADQEQVTVEALQHDELAAGHLLLHQDAESLTDITDRVLLEQRATSIAALRASPAEQIGVRPTGHRQLARRWPLPATLEDLVELRWEAGDGVLVQQAHLNVRDTSPRQMLGVQWTLVPDGVTGIEASFRQRPAALRTVLRSLARSLALATRAHTP